MAMGRRSFSREFKLDAIEQLDSGKSFARVAREVEVHENVLRRWRKEFRRRPNTAFSGHGKESSLSREGQLERKIGQMTLEIDFLKKALKRVAEQELQERAGAGTRSTRRSSKK